MTTTTETTIIIVVIIILVIIFIITIIDEKFCSTFETMASGIIYHCSLTTGMMVVSAISLLNHAFTLWFESSTSRLF